MIFKTRSGGLRYLARLKASVPYPEYMARGSGHADSLYVHSPSSGTFTRRDGVFSGVHVKPEEHKRDIDGLSVLRAELFCDWPDELALPLGLEALRPTGARGDAQYRLPPGSNADYYRPELLSLLFDPPDPVPPLLAHGRKKETVATELAFRST
jgi:hypothetical protein